MLLISKCYGAKTSELSTAMIDITTTFPPANWTRFLQDDPARGTIVKVRFLLGNETEKPVLSTWANINRLVDLSQQELKLDKIRRQIREKGEEVASLPATGIEATRLLSALETIKDPETRAQIVTFHAEEVASLPEEQRAAELEKFADFAKKLVSAEVVKILEAQTQAETGGTTP